MGAPRYDGPRVKRVTYGAPMPPGESASGSTTGHPLAFSQPGPRTVSSMNRAGYVALIADGLRNAAESAPVARRALPRVHPRDNGGRLDDGGRHSDAWADGSDGGSFEGGGEGGDGCWTVYAISDLHTDMKANMQWVRGLPRYPPRSALIVAGDVATAVKVIRDTLSALKEKFEEVFYCPGNHDLWTPAAPNDWTRAGYPEDSLGKLRLVLDSCAQIGVRTVPTLLPGAEPRGTAAARDEAPGQCDDDTTARGSRLHVASHDVLIVPMFSWYKDSFGDNDPSGYKRGPGYTALEQNFDAGCMWPPSVGNPAVRRDSHHPGIADFFLAINRGGEDGDGRSVRSKIQKAAGGVSSLEESDSTSGAATAVVSFSHFLPHMRLFRGHPRLNKVMGCDELGEQVKALGSAVHVFGHSHLDVDETIAGTRFVQCALGYPNERWGPEPSGPKKVWPPPRGKSITDKLKECIVA